MSQPKTNIQAIQPFAHGNVDAIPGRVYAMNSADADDLVKAGFAVVATDGNAAQTQNDEVAQVKNVGDVVVDDADDLLGDSKAEKDLDNKMAGTASNKRAATTHKK